MVHQELEQSYDLAAGPRPRGQEFGVVAIAYVQVEQLFPVVYDADETAELDMCAVSHPSDETLGLLVAQTCSLAFGV